MKNWFLVAILGVAGTILLRATGHQVFIWIFVTKLGILHPFVWEAMGVALVMTFVSFFLPPSYKLSFAASASGLSVCALLLAIADSACATGMLLFAAITFFMIQRALRLLGRIAVSVLWLITAWMALVLGIAVTSFGW